MLIGTVTRGEGLLPDAFEHGDGSCPGEGPRYDQKMALADIKNGHGGHVIRELGKVCISRGCIVEVHGQQGDNGRAVLGADHMGADLKAQRLFLQ